MTPKVDKQVGTIREKDMDALMGKGRGALLAIALALSFGGQAQPSTAELPQVRLPQGEGWSHPEAADHLQLGLKLSSSSYFRADTHFFKKRGVVSDVSDLTFDFSYRWQGVLQGEVDLTNRFALQEDANYLMPKNLYAGWQDQKWKVWAGRKWYLWSEADEHLKRGLYQGRFMNDKLRKDSHGLTGVFLESRWRRGSVLFFASPLFVPEFGPDHQIIDGDFYSPNPYFRPPSASLNFLGVDTPLKYSVVNPVESDVVLNESLAVRLEQHWENWFVRASHAYKPMNQMLLAGQFVFQHKEAGQQDIRVRVYPRVQYHHLSTLEGGWQRSGGLTSWLSYSFERPEFDSIPREWTYQNTGKTGILTAYVGHDVNVGPKESSHVFAAYSRVDGGDRPDAGEFTARETLFERRYQFIESAELGLRNGYWLRKQHRLSWGARGIYDFVQQGLAFMTDAAWSWGPQWQLYGAVDLLGIVDEKAAEVSDGFLGEYRSNDRFSLGVSYVF